MKNIKTIFTVLSLSFLFTTSLTSLFGEIYETSQGVTLEEPGSLMGRVVSKNTLMPISGAKIDLVRMGEVQLTTETDLEGNYFIPDVPAKLYIVRAYGGNFKKGWHVAPVDAGKTKIIDFSLSYQPRDISGVIIDSLTGEPIVDSYIDVYENEKMIEMGETDEEGNYTISIPPLVSCQLKIYADDYQLIKENVQIDLDEILPTFNYALKPYGSITGQVTHARSKQPVKNAFVEIWQGDERLNDTETDEQGFFTIKGIEECRLVIRAPEFDTAETSMTLLPRETIEQNIHLFSPRPTAPVQMLIKCVSRGTARSPQKLNNIQWQKSEDPTVIFYRLYRDGKIIGQISANAPRLFYDQVKGRQGVTYILVSVNQEGRESAPLTGAVGPKKR